MWHSLEFAARRPRIAVLERSKIGGSCINYDCAPSKAFLAAAHSAARAPRRAGRLGVRAQVEVAFTRVMDQVLFGGAVTHVKSGA